mgnify:CR=1 FL=1
MSPINIVLKHALLTPDYLGQYLYLEQADTIIKLKLYKEADKVTTDLVHVPTAPYEIDRKSVV